MRRLHRWVRGDWQLLPWLWLRVRSSDGSLGRNRLGSIQRWKMLDNLRRSVQLHLTMLLLVAAGAGLLPGQAWEIERAVRRGRVGAYVEMLGGAAVMRPT